MMISEIKNLKTLVDEYVKVHPLDADEKILLADFARVVDKQFVLSINQANQVKIKDEGGDYHFEWKDDQDGSK